MRGNPSDIISSLRESGRFHLLFKLKCLPWILKSQQKGNKYL
ncbi:hypothetical protein OROMI_028744 [Orobanche minor]